MAIKSKGKSKPMKKVVTSQPKKQLKQQPTKTVKKPAAQPKKSDKPMAKGKVVAVKKSVAKTASAVKAKAIVSKSTKKQPIVKKAPTKQIIIPSKSKNISKAVPIIKPNVKSSKKTQQEVPAKKQKNKHISVAKSVEPTAVKKKEQIAPIKTKAVVKIPEAQVKVKKEKETKSKESAKVEVDLPLENITDENGKKRGRKSKKDKEAEEVTPVKKAYSELSPEELELLEEERKEKEKKQVQRFSEDDVRESLLSEVVSLTEDYTVKDIFDSLKVIDYFKSETGDCLEKGCDNPDTTGGYCRFHYIKHWTDIKKRQEILKEGRLQSYIEGLTEKYPMMNLEVILSDLTDEKSFFKALREMNIESADDNFDEFSDDQSEDDEQDIAYETRDTFDIKEEIE